jgi:hypothetical protein
MHNNRRDGQFSGDEGGQNVWSNLYKEGRQRQRLAGHSASFREQGGQQKIFAGKLVALCANSRAEID